MFHIDRPLNFIAFGFLTSVKIKQKTSVCFFKNWYFVPCWIQLLNKSTR